MSVAVGQLLSVPIASRKGVFSFEEAAVACGKVDGHGADENEEDVEEEDDEEEEDEEGIEVEVLAAAPELATFVRAAGAFDEGAACKLAR